MSDLKRVFLVDDEKLFLDSLTKVLRKRDMEVKAAYSGTEAVSVLADEIFDVIVLDLKMPGMDGLATLKAIREKDAITPVILLTGHINIEMVTQVLKMGAAEVLLKPCPVDTLVSAIENAHERSAAAEGR